ncbi:MAG: hypothetical protein OXC69_07515, partial [Candidatus Tectomicrobia bacterium]|nr:hypothetical protein [Candidatus Tectomicrobia bacterium]
GGGGMDANGGHFVWKTGEYHYHRGKGAEIPPVGKAQADRADMTKAGINGMQSVTEDDYNQRFFQSVGGQTETRHNYPQGYVRVDCETVTHVYEGDLDKRSSIDSLQHALLFSHLTGKTSVVVIYDTDGVEGKFEYRIRVACEKAGVQYRSIPTI